VRKLKKVEDEGGDIRSIGPAPTVQAQDNLVPCPYCTRRFAPNTAERHIPKCKDIINKPKPIPLSSNVRSSLGSTALKTNGFASSNINPALHNFESNMKANTVQGKYKAYADIEPKGSQSSKVIKKSLDVTSSKQTKDPYDPNNYGLGGGVVGSGYSSKANVGGMGTNVGGMGMKVGERPGTINYGTSPNPKVVSSKLTSSIPTKSTNVASNKPTTSSIKEPTISTVKPQGGFKLYQGGNSNAYNY